MSNPYANPPMNPNAPFDETIAPVASVASITTAPPLESQPARPETLSREALQLEVERLRAALHRPRSPPEDGAQSPTKRGKWDTTLYKLIKPFTGAGKDEDGIQDALLRWIKQMDEFFLLDGDDIPIQKHFYLARAKLGDDALQLIEAERCTVYGSTAIDQLLSPLTLVNSIGPAGITTVIPTMKEALLRRWSVHQHAVKICRDAQNAQLSGDVTEYNARFNNILNRAIAKVTMQDVHVAWYLSGFPRDSEHYSLLLRAYQQKTCTTVHELQSISTTIFVARHADLARQARPARPPAARTTPNPSAGHAKECSYCKMNGWTYGNHVVADCGRLRTAAASSAQSAPRTSAQARSTLVAPTTSPTIPELPGDGSPTGYAGVGSNAR
ncbi:hypothetical protein HKX48_009539 [Thoreauomyces humboldtii]|nr:hypothetical protein HKX48_009539 [Thoreauomyces humboldtii]